MKAHFGNVAKYYAKYRNDLPVQLFETLIKREIDFKGKKVVDLGSGTGVLSRALQDRGAFVVGVEPSAELIKEAKRIDECEKREVEYVNAFSEMTTLKEKSFDFVTVLRAWHWFDREQALYEIRRILKDKGILIVMDSGFTSKKELVSKTLKMIKDHLPNGLLPSPGSKANATQFINGCPVEWFKEWQDHQFDMTDTYKFSYTVPFSIEEWCGRVGTLSWLSNFTDEKRTEILNEIYSHLKDEWGKAELDIEHVCSVTILHLL